ESDYLFTHRCPSSSLKKQQQEEGEAKRSSHLLQIFDLKSALLILGSNNSKKENSVEHLLRVPDAKGMRNRPFSFYEDWLILFGKDRVTGELVEDPADAVTAMEKEDANATTEEGEQSPIEQFSMNIGDTDYSMSTAGNVPNRADSTKTGEKRA
ncbi:hypothetical protein HYC85_025490, partial [Camellia sinensis]